MHVQLSTKKHMVKGALINESNKHSIITLIYKRFATKFVTHGNFIHFSLKAREKLQIQTLTIALICLVSSCTSLQLSFAFLSIQISEIIMVSSRVINVMSQIEVNFGF